MVVLVKTAWNGSPISQLIANPSVLEISNSHVVIGFDGQAGESFEKSADLSEEDNEAWTNVDANLETAEDATKEAICETWRHRTRGR
ncbi:hypothetical protein AVEN_117138-1 [Araneus ventricosus]|uniref:Uncharacterized protein n=1 Tax=Araneus ventricosus TaxID=182803 RepID=A0A4Y2AZS9_ARAVE|nr:hypothetical protein AVEN_117138-1 [Araneus ventricosus]